MSTDKQIPIANASDHNSTFKTCLFEMSAGTYAPATCYIWADHLEDALEVFMEWLDENAPGCLYTHEHHTEAIADAILERFPEFARYSSEALTQGGQTWFPLDHRATCEAFHAEHALGGMIDEEAEAVLQAAETDVTMCGHTSLTHGVGIVSHEWFAHEVDSSSDEYKHAKAESIEASFDFDALVSDLQDVRDNCVEPCGECRACKHGFVSECSADGPVSIDVRLQLEESGDYRLHSGDSSYDQDHRGHWGASSVASDTSDETLLETAKDLLQQALEGMCS